MREKKFLLILVLAGLVIVLLFQLVLAYSSIPTHSSLAEKSAQLFNQNNQNKLSLEDVQKIIQGAIKEDTPPRWINHLYDPMTGLGWQGEKMGKLPPELVNVFALLFLSQAPPVSALNWAHNQELQARYLIFEGNRTFEKAVYDYIKGDKKQAYRSLGHVLHLIEDMAVPAHTRQDTHAGILGDISDPYEKWAEKNTNFSRLDNLELSGENFSCQDLDDCLKRLAQYSNENFFSEDTILDENYSNPFIDSYQKIDRYTEFGLSKDGNFLVKIFINPDDNSIDYYTLQDNIIHSSYWQLLSKKAVLAGKEVLRIFQEEVARAEKDPSLLKKPPISYQLIFSPYGLAVKLKNDFFRTVERINSDFSFLENKLTSLWQGLSGNVSDFFSNIFSLEPDEIVDINNSIENSEPKEENQNPIEQNNETELLTENLDYDFQFISQGQMNLSLLPEQEADLELKIKNTGQENWEKGKVSLNVDLYKNPYPVLFYHPSWPTPLRPAFFAEDLVKSGEIAFLKFKIKAPRNESQTDKGYSIYFRPVYQKDNIFYWLGRDFGFHWNITVKSLKLEEKIEEIKPETPPISQESSSSENDQLPLEEIEEQPAEKTEEPVIEVEEPNNNPELLTENTETPFYPRRGDSTPPKGGMKAFDQNNHSYESTDNLMVGLEIINSEDTRAWLISETQNEKPSRDDPNWLLEKPSTFNLSEGDGLKTIYLWLKDGAGNIGSSQTSIYLDTSMRLAVVINEIAWMGTKASPYDEWIELYNTKPYPIDLTGWRIKTNDQEVILDQVISGYDYYLLLKNDYSTITGRVTAARQIYTLNLSNSGEKLDLYNKDNKLVDQVDCSIGWFAGNRENKLSMERVKVNISGNEPTNWQNNNPSVLKIHKDRNNQDLSATPGYINSAIISTPLPNLTYLPEIISQDTILTKDKSPYYLFGTGLQINSGVILTIEPGVIVKFSMPGNGDWCTESRIINYGEIIAQGTVEEPIVFTSIFDPDYYPLPYYSSQCGGQDGAGIKIYGSAVFDQVIFQHFTLDRDLKGVLYLTGNGQLTLKNAQFKASNGSLLYLENNSQAEVENIDIIGPSNYSQGITLINNSQLSLKNSSLSYLSTGISVGDEAQATLKSNRFFYNDKPLVKAASAILNLESNFYQDNTNNVVFVTKGVMTNEQVWSAELTYYLSGGILVDRGGKLILSPGTVIKSVPTRATACSWGCSCDPLNIVVRGKIESQGTATQPVVFTSYDDINYPGTVNSVLPDVCDSRWGKLIIDSTADVSGLSNMVIKNGGQIFNGWFGPEPGAALEIHNQSFILDNIIFENNSNALWIGKSPDFEVNNSLFNNNEQAIKIIDSRGKIENSQFNNNQSCAFEAQGNIRVDPINITGSGNKYNAFCYIGKGRDSLSYWSSLVEPSHWYKNHGFTYWVRSTLYLYAPLTIDPGVVIKFRRGDSGYNANQINVSRSDEYGEGSLIAQGTKEEPIVFTSWRDNDYGQDLETTGDLPSKEDWFGLALYAGQENILDNVIIRYGYYGIESSRPISLTNSLIENCSAYGIRLIGESVSDSIIENNTIRNNYEGLEVGGNVFVLGLHHNNIYNNFLYGIKKEGEGVIDARENWWGDASGPWHWSNPTGLGNRVSDGVNFGPWLVEPAE